MSETKIKRGYDVPMAGAPRREVVDAPRPDVVAIRPNEFRAIKPKILVKEGETVAAGAPLFFDRERPEIKFPSPGGGEVIEVRRGARRVCLEIFIRLAADEPFAEAPAWGAEKARQLTREQIVEALLDSGLWTTLRRRPFHVIPDADARPEAVFIGGSDSSPLPFDHSLAMEGRDEDFQLGIDLLGKLTEGSVHLATTKGAPSCSAFAGARNCEKHEFSGPYPSGQIEAQIQFLMPAKKGREVWYLDAQDAASLGEWFRTGRFPVSRVVAVGGPNAADARHFRTRRGVSVATLQGADFAPASTRIVSGNILAGRQVSLACGLGHYDVKFGVIPEGDQPEFIGWMKPGFDKVSRFRTFATSMLPAKPRALDTKLGGGVRAHVATGLYEEVCAVGILPSYLMRSLLVEDMEEAESLGIADCAECGLCTYVCPSKIEFGDIIARGMEAILKEG
jgi:Na+-transporting NADH:ubiquinone oxidoreductase subunit A